MLEFQPGFPREQACTTHWQPTCPPSLVLMAFGPTGRLPEKHLPAAAAAQATSMNPALNQPPARQRCSRNLRGNNIRDKSWQSTGRVLISSAACGKI